MNCLLQNNRTKALGCCRHASRLTLAWGLASLCLLTTANAMAENNPLSRNNGKPETSLQSNNATVTGTVNDANGEPLVGATITAKGSSEKAVTDIDGRFSINVPVGTSLTVSFIGMKDKEVVAQRNMTVTLDDNVKMLDDLVVVGYGVM